MNELKNKMQGYEDTYKMFLEYGTPKVIRVDMRSGKSFTRDLQKPFDKIFSQCMINTMRKLCEVIPGAKIGFTQSDEISIIIKDLNKENQKVMFFNNSLTKIISNVASMATIFFNIFWDEAVMNFCKENGVDINTAKQERDKYSILQPYFTLHLCGMFDCRYFELGTEEDVKNYLQYRQQDCYVNSINQIAIHNFDKNQLEGINLEDRVKMLNDIGVKLNQYPNKYFKGQICYRVEDNRNGAVKTIWKDETAPNFYNNFEFINMLYKG